MATDYKETAPRDVKRLLVCGGPERPELIGDGMFYFGICQSEEIGNEIAKRWEERDALSSLLGSVVMKLLQERWQEAHDLALGVPLEFRTDGTPRARIQP